LRITPSSLLVLPLRQFRHFRLATMNPNSPPPHLATAAGIQDDGAEGIAASESVSSSSLSNYNRSVPHEFEVAAALLTDAKREPAPSLVANLNNEVRASRPSPIDGAAVESHVPSVDGGRHLHHGSNAPQSIDELLNRELAQLSLQEKINFGDEIHGFLSRAPPETPDFLREKFDAMQQHLGKLPNGSKLAYLEACRIQRQWLDASVAVDVHVLTEEYRLRFLRADLHDPLKAAVRYCKWLDLLVEFYGEVSLTRPLYLSDLSGAGESPAKSNGGNRSDDDAAGDALRLLKEGFVHLLPSRDRSGRRIVALIGRMGTEFPMRTRVSASLL
jgi:hypothetical protein